MVIFGGSEDIFKPSLLTMQKVLLCASLGLILGTADAKTSEIVLCDSTSQCPEESTCCKTNRGWGCCSQPKAVCCSDGVHCCPQGTTCDVTEGTCHTQDGTFTKWLEKTPAVSKKVEMVACDDGSECPEENTCCKMPSGSFGCCPVPRAVCCSDNFHCCPEDTTCGLNAGRCFSHNGSSTQWLEKTAAVIRKVEMIKCDDGSECAEDTTCCKQTSGSFGCCPMPQAVCCSDNVHCCPEGTTCNIEKDECSNHNGSVTKWLEKTPAVSRKVEMINCDDGSECLDGNTCCKMPSGSFGCCPVAHAECCADNFHCCPGNTTCSYGRCFRHNGTSTQWLEKTSAVRKKVEMIKCDDGSECPDGNTCCKMPSGSFGCCPVLNAVCCSDNFHCCTEGTTCSIFWDGCMPHNHTGTQWVDTTPALPRNVEIVECDETHECPDGSTCCETSKGLECCPRPKWLEKTPAVKKKVDMIKCDDGSECPEGNTCCEMPSGSYGCCPVPKAVCCSDKFHCCPEGTICKSLGWGCSFPNGSVIPWLEKTAAVSKKVEMVKLDKAHECPDGTTCCKTSTGLGSCPLSKAVCCSDGVHCCPQGTTCDVTQGKCNRQHGRALPWLEKKFTLLPKIQPQPMQSVPNFTCPDNINICPIGNTCCAFDIDTFACCPITNAMCCSDKMHCCPYGHYCFPPTGDCITRWETTPP